MQPPTQIVCSRCGAVLADVREGAWVKCKACKTTHRAGGPMGDGSGAGGGDVRPAPEPKPARSSSRLTRAPQSLAPVLWAVAGLTSLAGSLWLVVGDASLGRWAGSLSELRQAHDDTPASWRWEGSHSALLVDTDGDGESEIVGRVMTGRDGRARVAALDGQSGNLLWQTVALGNERLLRKALLAASQGVMLLALPSGTLRGFALADGRPLWTAELPARVVRWCTDAGDAVTVVLETGSAMSLELSTGYCAGGELPPPPRCVRLEHDEQHWQLGTEAVPRRRWPSGLDVRLAIRRDHGPEVFLGVSSRGRPTPVVAVRSRDSSEDWSSPLLDGQWSGASASGPTVAALTEHRLFTSCPAPQRGDPPQLVAFSVAGRRLWVSPLETKGAPRAVQVLGQTVLVSQLGALSAYRASTGTLAFSTHR